MMGYYYFTMRGVKTAKEECLSGPIESRNGTIIVLTRKARTIWTLNSNRA
jgi:hypothetical protein